MTAAKYKDLNNIDYAGKHAKKWYDVRRVLGPTYPAENIQVFGLDEAIYTVQGCWKWEIRNHNTGEIVHVS